MGVSEGLAVDEDVPLGVLHLLILNFQIYMKQFNSLLTPVNQTARVISQASLVSNPVEFGQVCSELLIFPW